MYSSGNQCEHDSIQDSVQLDALAPNTFAYYHARLRIVAEREAWSPS